jgi:hypothetical protein
MVKRHKGNVFMTNIKNAMFEAYKTKNIPKLNDISQLLMELIYNNQQFRIEQRHLEPQGLYDDLDSFVSLYSQNLKFVSKLEFRS